MKTVKITYHCDYCKKVIDQDSDTVMAIMPGRIGYEDDFIPDGAEKIQHYHDYCLAHILSLAFKPEPEPEQEQEQEKPKKEKYDPHKGEYKGPVCGKKKDLGAMKALLDAGWTKAKVADEFGVHVSTIYNWVNEMKEEGNKDDGSEVQA